MQSERQKPITYNSRVSLEKLFWDNYVDSGRVQGRFGGVFGAKLNLTTLMQNSKCSGGKKNETVVWFKTLHWNNQNSNKFVRKRDQLVIAAESFNSDQNLSANKLQQRPRIYRKN